ncbi:MAG: DUF2339 domain-containing protein [Fimbriimonadaceae bacterium]|nr:DUF2339 domain-containing protein [Chthonomonadaceae bacterium]MCO5295776.1 DUF2339 domain-containing protein [Fimbriimonadaceae bacterium]
MTENEEELVRRLEAFESRLLRIEMRLGIVRHLPPPPPVVTQASPDVQASQSPPVQVGAWGTATGQPRLQPSTTAEPQSAADAEYQVGGRLLPWAGALVTILAIGYGVNLAFQHGFITPWMIFWGGVTLCAAFIVVGQIKRDEREEFGQLLTGIGSCGLYITFAAGHLAQHLYEGEALVSLFMGLSLVNLAYSGWRASHAFFIIGILGGFAGALLPMQEGKIVLHLGLHALILIPSAIIVIRQNWFREASALFVLAFAVLLPAQTYSHHEWLRALSLEGTALLAAFAYARTHRPAEDPQGALGCILLAGAAMMALLARNGLEGTAHVTAFGIAVVLLSRSFGERPIALPLLVTGAAIPFVIAPWGFEAAQRPYVFAALAAVLAAVSRFRWDRTASALSGVVFVLGVASLVLLGILGPILWTSETGMLGALLVGGTLATAATIRAWKDPEVQVMVGALVLAPMLIRIVTLGMSRQLGAVNELSGALWGMALATSVLGALSVQTRWRSPAILGALLWCIALAVYASDLVDRTVFLGWELGLVVGLAGSAIACTVALWGTTEKGRPMLAGVAGAALGVLLWRFVLVALSKSSLAFEPHFASVLGATLASVCCTAVGRWRAWPGLAAPTGLFWVLAGLVAMDGSPFPSALNEGIAMTVLLAAGTWGAVAFDRAFEPGLRSASRFFAAAILGVPFSRLVVLLLTDPSIGVPPLSAVTIAWTAYGAVLLGIGFAKRVREIRYVGLGALAAASLKLVLVDLASSRDLVRFLVTLGLGVAMIGGGYLYIRLQDRLEEGQGPLKPAPHP